MNKEKNILQLKKRLEEVGLSLDIYKKLPPKYVRINPHFRVSKAEMEKGLGTKLEKVKALDYVFKTSGVIRTGELYEKGFYHIQDLSSLVSVLLLDLRRGEALLDLCAAPGLKSAFAYDLMKGQISITCVDKNRKRFNKMLKYFYRYGIKAKVFCQDGVKLKGSFDKVIVDAPCSGEGIVSKYYNILEESDNRVKRRAKIQRRLLQNGFNLLKESGILVYFTCTLNKYENEGVIKKFLEKNKNAKLETKIPELGLDVKKSDFGVRILPGKTRGGFVSRIIKSE